MTGEVFGTGTNKIPGSTQIEGIGTTNFGGRSLKLMINVVQFIVNMRNFEKKSVPRETNGQDQTTPETSLSHLCHSLNW